MQLVSIAKKAIAIITNKAKTIYSVCHKFTKHTVLPLIKKVALFFKRSPRAFAAVVSVFVLVSLATTVAVATNALDEEIAKQNIIWFAMFMLCGAGATATLIKVDKRRKKAKE